MSIVAGGMTKTPRPLIPAGTHVATLYRLMNLGTRFQMYKGETKEYPDKVIRLTWEVPGETFKFTKKADDGSEEEHELPLVVDKEFNLTMGPKSKLRPFVEGIIGVQLKDEEAYAFDLESLVGKSCLITVAHKESKGNMYANIMATAPLMKGMVPPKQVNESTVFDINTCTREEVDALPQFLKDKTTISDEYKARFGTEDTPNVEEDEVPF